MVQRRRRLQTRTNKIEYKYVWSLSSSKKKMGISMPRTSTLFKPGRAMIVCHYPSRSVHGLHCVLCVCVSTRWLDGIIFVSWNFPAWDATTTSNCIHKICVSHLFMRHRFRTGVSTPSAAAAAATHNNLKQKQKPMSVFITNNKTCRETDCKNVSTKWARRSKIYVWICAAFFRFRQ